MQSRNHRPEIMYKAFEIAGYPQEQVETEFAGMLNALKFGAPPAVDPRPVSTGLSCFLRMSRIFVKSSCSR